METYSFVYVILHYMTLEDTVKAVDSVRRTGHDSGYKIIVVENGSQNGTADRLTELYQGSSDVDVVCSETNLGFANGNNLGVRYCREHYEFEYLIVMNNDIECRQPCMEQRIREEYNTSSFDVSGPLILSGDGRYDSSPVRKLPVLRKDAEKNLRREKRLLRLEQLHLSGAYRFASGLFRKKKYRKLPCAVRTEDVILHGCFIVFSRKYFDAFEDAFDSRTFLYHEEELLGLRIQRQKMKSVFTPEVYVYHKEDSASEAAWNDPGKRRIFKLQQCIRSSEVLLSDL